MIYNLYLIYAEVDGIGQWKIGVSKHPEKRLKELKTANPNIKNLHVVYEVENKEIAYMIEAKLKKHLKDFKINGEWVEYLALNDKIFIEYCKYYDIICTELIKIKQEKKYNKKYENYSKTIRPY